jgi:hypothetical protein
MLDNERNAGLTLAVGHAGSETAVRGSFGFEFGGDRPMRFDLSELMPAPAAVAPEPEPVPAGMVLVYEDELEELQLMAENSEDYEEHIEQTEYRYAQQQNQIDALQREHENDEAEIERLKQEAAALRERQEADEELRQSVRQRILEKRKGDEKGTD